MKKYIAKQIDPEIQTSPMFYGGSIEMESWPDISIYGNKDCCEYMTPAFEQLIKGIDEAAGCVIDMDKVVSPWFSNMREIVHAYFPYGEPYTDEQIEMFGQALRDWTETSKMSDEQYILCSAMEIMTGEPYNVSEIKGCCQRDWQYIYYPTKDYNKQTIDYLESEYFNTGSEWMVIEEPVEINNATDPYEIDDLIADYDSCGIYCYSWNNDGIRKEIADSFGIPADEILLLEYDGYTRLAKYKIG